MRQGMPHDASIFWVTGGDRRNTAIPINGYFQKGNVIIMICHDNDNPLGLGVPYFHPRKVAYLLESQAEAVGNSPCVYAFLIEHI